MWCDSISVKRLVVLCSIKLRLLLPWRTVRQPYPKRASSQLRFPTSICPVKKVAHWLALFICCNCFETCIHHLPTRTLAGYSARPPSCYWLPEMLFPITVVVLRDLSPANIYACGHDILHSISLVVTSLHQSLSRYCPFSFAGMCDPALSGQFSLPGLDLLPAFPQAFGVFAGRMSINPATSVSVR